jgi:hypothetical protein
MLIRNTLSSVLILLLVVVLPTPIVNAQDDDARMITGASWVGRGINMLGIVIDEDGNAKNDPTLQKRHWLIAGLSERQDDFESYEKTISMEDGDADLKFQVPKLLEVLDPQAADRHKRVTYLKESVHELHQESKMEYSVEASYSGFSSKFSSSSESTYDSSVKTYYAWTHDTRTDFHLVLSDINVKDHLATGFEAALNDETVTPAELFEEYGTHLIAELTMGRRKEMTTVKKDTESSSETTIRQEIEAGFDGFMSASANAKKEGTTKRTDRVEEATTVETSTGYVGKPGIMGFKREDHQALRPIWNFCSDASRKKEIQDAYRTLEALHAITTPILFTSVMGGDGTDNKHPELALAVPKGYKIISGGARVESADVNGRGICDSFPENTRTWKARGSATRGGKIGISVLAIFDPHDYWKVSIERRQHEGSKNQYDRWTEYAYVGDYDAAPVGGGARLESTDGSHCLFGSAPLENLKAFDGADWAAWTKSIQDHYRHFGNDSREIGLWAASAYNHAKAAEGEIISYLIRIKPSIKSRGKYARRIEIESGMFVETNSNHTWTMEATMRASGDDGDLILVGGGAYAIGRGQYLIASHPIQAMDGGGDLEWHAAASSWNKDNNSPNDLLVFAIGLRATLAED